MQLGHESSNSLKPPIDQKLITGVQLHARRSKTTDSRVMKLDLTIPGQSNVMRKLKKSILKVRYLTIQFEDPDSKVSGVTSFKLENKDMLEAVLDALAQKTGMTRRGDIYVKKKDEAKATP